MCSQFVLFVIKLMFSYIQSNHLTLGKAEHVGQEPDDSKFPVIYLLIHFA